MTTYTVITVGRLEKVTGEITFGSRREAEAYVMVRGGYVRTNRNVPPMMYEYVLTDYSVWTGHTVAAPTVIRATSHGWAYRKAAREYARLDMDCACLRDTEGRIVAEFTNYDSRLV